jgi:molybdopterin-guanine dinucleotide biosynthesis protein MobB
MKVISVAGYSGSGKTTFIRSLVPVLVKYGPVGTLKHTGHHSMQLPPGKDTTLMFDAGAFAVAGIDQEKTLLTLRAPTLMSALDFLAAQGAAFAVIEGFKTSPLPKIVIGDLEAERCVLRNPAPEDVPRFLSRFPEYVTMAGILRDIGHISGRAGGPAPVATFSGLLSPPCCGDALHSKDRRLTACARAAEDLPGVIAVRIALRNGSLFGGRDELLIALAGENGAVACNALKVTAEQCRARLARTGITLG